MKILTLNVRSWYRDMDPSLPTYWRNRADKMKEYIKKRDPDVILFQEMLFPMTRYIPDEWKRVPGISISHHVYCRRSFNVEETGWNMHLAYALITIPGSGPVAFVSVHSRWDEKTRTKVARQVLEIAACHQNTIVGGDWNNGPEVMTPLLQPMTVIAPECDTFQNWTNPESHGTLDYFALMRKPERYILTTSNTDISDHIPVILEL